MTSTTQTTIALEKHEMSLMMLMLAERIVKVHGEVAELPQGTIARQSRVKAIKEMDSLQAKLEASYRESFLARS